MITGVFLPAFTAFHVVLSLIGIVAGVVVLIGMLGSRSLGSWTALFVWTTVLTSVTGFLFPAERVLPSHIVGVLSLVVLTLAIVALYRFRLAGRWRWIYVTTALTALYFNVFVLVVQAFLKVSSLKQAAPRQTEPPFVIAQLAVLVVFLALGFMAVRSFHPRGAAAARAS